MTKVVLITGCSSGLGLHSAILFAQNGHSVFASMRDLAKQEALIAEANTHGVELNLVQLDVCDTKSVEPAVAQVIEQAGRIDLLVNNAGAGFARSTEQATESEIQWVMDLNFHGVVRCTKAVIPHMRKQRSGHIINITSVGGLVGQPFNELYCAAKFAVEGYTEGMASYLTEAFGIHFSAVEPGGISSEFAASAFKKIEESGGFLEDDYLPTLQRYIAGFQQRNAAGESGVYQTPREVAQVLLECSQMDIPPVRMRTSQWAEDFCQLKTSADPSGLKLRDAVVSKFL